MADTAFNAFTLVTSLTDTDLFLGYRAGGGINFTPLTLAAYAGQHAAIGSAALPGMAFASDPDTGIYRPAANVLAFSTAGTESARIDAAGLMGLGTTSPLARLHVAEGAGAPTISAGTSAIFARTSTSSAFTNVSIIAGNASVSTLNFGDTDAENIGYVQYSHASDYMRVIVNNAERLRIESNGVVRPGGDNTQANGSASFRWSGGNIATAWVVTSDEREKLWIIISEDRRAKDLRIAYAILDELGWYQRLDSIEEKGKDGARWHFGARAQAVWSIVAAEGLCAPLVSKGSKQRPDPTWDGPPPPAWLCYDVWGEERSSEPVYSETILGPDEKPMQTGTREVVTREAGNRFGLRTDQLDLLLSWALHERDKEKDALIANLTARLEALEEPEWQGGLMDGEL